MRFAPDLHGPLAGHFSRPDERAPNSFIFWRRKRDSNPRTPSDVNGFQDRRLQPLGHSSDTILADKSARFAENQISVPLHTRLHAYPVKDFSKT